MTQEVSALRRPKIGLLPLYLALYDELVPEARARMDAFADTIASEFEKKGLEVARTEVCRLSAEFAAVVKSFEEVGADAIVTLHLAYSPSLESSEALARTRLPIIVLDTSPTHAYSPSQDSAELMFNHGIHGVMDMCNLLIRNGKQFQIEAGHWEKSDVLDRVAAWARAAKLASDMRSARIGRIGESFKGMGDFAISDHLMSAIGVRTVPCDLRLLKSLVPADDDPDVRREIELDQAICEVEADQESQLNSARAGIAVRRWIEKEKLTGFTVNFGSVDASTGLPTVPFLEASKAMARGLGYAGEGDVLTAALVGALASSYPDTSFTEVFCADWEGESIFINHMGEMNIALADGKPVLMKKDMPFIKPGAPALGIGRFRAGEAVFVNLAPGPEDTFTLIVAPVQMLGVEGEDKMRDLIRGWFRPAMPISDFLESYSRLGGTHHSALVYGDVADDLARFGEMMGWDVAVLG